VLIPLLRQGKCSLDLQTVEVERDTESHCSVYPTRCQRADVLKYNAGLYALKSIGNIDAFNIEKCTACLLSNARQ